MRPIRLFRTSALRLTLLFSLLFALCVGLLFGAIEVYATRTLEAGLRATVDARLSGLIGAEPVTTPHIVGAAAASVQQSQGAYILLEDWTGARLAGNLPAIRPITGWIDITVDDKGTLVPVIARGVRLLDGGYLLVGQDASRVGQVRGVIGRAFAIGGALTLLFASAAGYWFSRRILQRLAAVARTSQEIADGDLSRRLPVRGTGDEFDQLLDGFNALLDRIALLIDSLRQVSSDIAHDLRTPLTRLLHRLEELRDRADAGSQHREGIDRAIAEANSVLETFAALLRITQIEAGTGRERFEDLDAAEVVEVAAELYSPLAQERGQELTLRTRAAPCKGDRELLIQMLANLLENACRHTPPGSRIEAGAAPAPDGSGVLIWVEDNGPGIPESEREAVFRRFYRLEASRTAPGNGIGLSLAAAIAARHGGRIALSDAGPGLRAEIRLPSERRA